MKNLTRSLILFICCMSTNCLFSQDTICDLSCNDLVFISLDSSCQNTVEPLDVLVQQDTSADCGIYRVELEYPYGQYSDLAPNNVDNRLRGQKIVYKVIDTLTGNSCWGYVQIEDKHPPRLDCTSDTIFCFDPVPEPVADALDCGYSTSVEILRLEWTPFDCAADSMFIGYLERDIRASDKWGNYTECTQRIYYLKLDVDTIECIEEKTFECLTPELWDTTYVYFDENGRAIPKPLVEDGKNVGLVEPPFVIEGMDTIYLWPNHESCQVFVYYEDHVIPTCGASYKIRRFWTIKDWCDSSEQNCIQWIPIIDTTPAYPEYTDEFPPIKTITTNAHDCKAHLELKRPPILEECTLKAGIEPEVALSKLKVRYEFHYEDPYSENNHVIYRDGEIPYGEAIIEYVPPTGLFQPIEIIYTIIDECWNDTSISQMLIVRDNDPPIPICDELTQITLDPDSCWARVYAKDFDDGSYDNCADSLHYAIATMDDIEYWTNRWRDSLTHCHGHDYYYQNQNIIDSIIAEWVDFYVFDDFVDVTDCGRDSIVLRVYEQFNFPPYDPHVFSGSKHYWYNWYRSRFLLSRSFRCNYVLYYEDLLEHKGRMYPPLECENIEDYFLNDIRRKRSSDQYELTTEILDQFSEADNLDTFLIENCYDDDATKNAKIVSNLNTYPILRTFVQSSQAIRAFILGDVLRHLFFNLPYYNDCMVEIIKDDKQAPVCIAPENYTIYCDSVPYDFEWEPYGRILAPGKASSLCSHRTPNCDYDPDYLDGGLDVTNDWERIWCHLWLKLDTFDHPENEKKDITFGKPEYYDNCTPDDELDVQIDDKGELDECGTGYITRSWTITDACGNSSVCKQSIHVLPRSDYEVLFPEDIVIDCDEGITDLSPDGVAGNIVIADVDCEMIGTTWEDQIFNEDDESCYKILRTWKLVNWCAYNPDLGNHQDYDVVIDSTIVAGERRPCTYRYLKDGGDGYMEYLQVIKVKDYVKPTLDCDIVTLCSYDSSCVRGQVSGILGTATDNCTPQEDIYYRYTLVPDGATSSTDYIYGEGNELDGVYDFGKYEVTLIASDLCGNEDSCIFDLYIIDCKKPTPYCYNGIATVIMPSTGEVSVWASDLDAGSYDNCPGELVFSFDSLGEELSRTFTCQDIPNGNEQVITVEIWVFDVAGNKDFCTTYISLQDGDGNGCDDISTGDAQVLGSIYTENNRMLSGVSVWINNGAFQTSTQTQNNGVFMFDGIPMNTGYRVKPEKTSNIMDGISTLDILIIQKHLLGVQKFESPYKLIAADVNKSNSITALDIITLRKMILGNEGLPNGNTSWRFVDADHVFEDISKPWQFPIEIAIDLNKKNSNMDFVGIKVGDVNESASNSLHTDEAQVRSAHSIELEIQDKEVAVGDLIEIPVAIQSDQVVEGFQFGIELAGLEWVETTSDKINGSQQLWLKKSVHNIVASVTNPGGWDSEGALFVIKAKAVRSGKLSEMVILSNEYIVNEGYLLDETRVDLTLNFNQVEEVSKGDLALDQNSPNPFTDNTVINIRSNKDQTILFSVFDVKGKVILEEKRQIYSGLNSISLSSNLLESAGIYYYQIKTPLGVKTRKMIKVN